MTNVAMTNAPRITKDPMTDHWPGLAGRRFWIGPWVLHIHWSLVIGHRSFLIFLLLALSAIASRAGDWPQWRGPNRNAYAPADAPAIKSLPTELKPVWKISIGGGVSSPIVAGGKLVYLDVDEGKEVAHLLQASSGQEIWRIPYANAFQDEWGAGPRSTPILDGGRLYVQSCTGEFRCLNLADGKTIWGVSYEKDFGVKFLGSKANEGTASRRRNNGSGVIDGDKIILPVGSTSGASLICF